MLVYKSPIFKDFKKINNFPKNNLCTQKQCKLQHWTNNFILLDIYSWQLRLHIEVIYWNKAKYSNYYLGF